jgi:hypothetical protein
MQEIINFSKGTLQIEYWKDFENFSLFLFGGYANLLKFTFFPNIEMTQQQSIDYTNEIMNEIIREAKTIVSENMEFYKNFEIDYTSEFSAFVLYKNKNNKDIVRSSEMYIKLKK